VAEVLDLQWDQGSRWIGVFIPQVEWLATLAGYSARGKVKASRTLAGSATLFDVSNYMTVQGEQVVVDIPANILAAQQWTSGAYDFELYDSDPTHDVRFLQGIVTLDKEVTT
jgi:hypothetical protein